MLKSIKTNKCPICGCTDIVEERVEVSEISRREIKEHCNGTRWEHRKFLCGYRFQYEPNYSREVESKNSECCYDKEVIARKKKEKEDKERLVELLKENNISEELIDRVKTHCLY